MRKSFSVSVLYAVLALMSCLTPAWADKLIRTDPECSVWAQVRSNCTSALVSQPHNPKILVLRSWCSKKLADYDCAFKDADLALSSYSAKQHYDLPSELLFSNGYGDLAYCRVSLDDDARGPWFALRERGDVYSCLKQYHRALTDYNRAIRICSTSSENFSVRGLDNLCLGRFAAAINDFTDAISLDSSSYYDYRQRALCFFLNGQRDRAWGDLQATLRRNPNDPVAFLIRGLICEQMGRRESAMQDYEKSVQLLAPRLIDYRFPVPPVDTVEDVERLNTCEKMIKFIPRSPYLYVACSYLHRRLWQRHEAMDDAGKALSLDPDCGAAYDAQAAGYIEGQYLELRSQLLENCICVCTKSLQCSGNHRMAFALRGEALFQLGRTEQAVGDLRQALLLDADEGPILESLAQSYQSLRRYGAELEVRNKLVQLYPRNPFVYCGRCLTNYFLGRYYDCIADADMTSKLSDDEVFPYLIKGEAYQHLGLHAEAIAAFSEFLEKTPVCGSFGHRLRAKSRLLTGDLIGAAFDYLSCIQNDGTALSGLQNLAFVLLVPFIFLFIRARPVRLPIQ